MSLKSQLPVSRERTSVSRNDLNPFAILQREMDRLLGEFARGFPVFGSTDLTPTMDVTETEKEIELTAELPGLEEKEVEVNVADNVLTIRGEKKAEKEHKDRNYQLVERKYGSFSRSIELPAGINPDSIKATISKGVLKVTIPKLAPANVKKVDIKAAA